MPHLLPGNRVKSSYLPFFTISAQTFGSRSAWLVNESAGLTHFYYYPHTIITTMVTHRSHTVIQLNEFQLPLKGICIKDSEDEKWRSKINHRIYTLSIWGSEIRNKQIYRDECINLIETKLTRSIEQITRQMQCLWLSIVCCFYFLCSWLLTIDCLLLVIF